MENQLYTREEVARIFEYLMFACNYLINTEKTVEKEDFSDFAQWIWLQYQNSKSEFRSVVPERHKQFLAIILGCDE